MMTLAVYRVTPDGRRTDLVPEHRIDIDPEAAADVSDKIASEAYPSCMCALCTQLRIARRT